MTSEDVRGRWSLFWRGLSAQAHSTLRSPRWHRRLAWAVGGLLLFWALAWAAVPGLLKWQLEKAGSAKLGRQLTVGKVDFRPWSLELTLHDLAIAKRGTSPLASKGSPQESPQLGIKRLYIDAELQSLLRLAPVVDAIQVEDPVLSLTHLGQGRYDIDDIVARLKPAPDDPVGKPQRFALYNLVLTGGRADFHDVSVRKLHELRELNLSVPFLSNLRSQRDVQTSPRLGFALNGSRFDSTADGTPFAPTRKTDATFRFDALDLRPYLGYLPAGLPLQLQGGMLSADIKVAFEQMPETVVRLSGTLTADQVRLLGAAGAPASAPELLGFERLQVVMEDVRPLAQVVKLSSVELTSPVLNITRDRNGLLNLLPVAIKNRAADAGSAGAAVQNNAPTQAASAPAVPRAAIPAPARPPWKVQVASLAVRSGRVNWLDQSLASPAQIRLNGLVLDASAISYPFSAGAPVQFKGAIALDAAAVAAASPAVARRKAVQAGVAAPAAAATPALLSFSGSATDVLADVKATLAAWPLDMAAKYIGQFLLPALNGRLDADLGIQWQAAAGGRGQLLKISAPQLAVRDMLLAEGKTSLVSVQRVDVVGMDIDVAGQSFRAASMRLTQPKVRVDRDADRRWMYQRWMAAGAQLTPPPASASAPAWGVAIKEVSLDGGAISFTDRSNSKPVAFEVTGVKAQLQGLLLDERPAAKTQAAQPMPLSATLQLATGRFAPGKLDFKGSLGLAPLQAQGQLVLQRMPVQAFEPYFGEQLNIDLLRADASFRGRVGWRQTPAGPQAQLAGDMALEEFRSNTLAPGEGLLAWKALNLRGLKLALDPAKATRVDVRETVLSDFFARVIVTPEGRINLQDLLKPPASDAPGATKSGAVDARPAGAGGQNDTQTRAAAPAPVINVGPMTLINGRVLFSDRFVKPNYSANLSELGGKLSAFSSAPAAGAPAMADLELRGRAEGSASLEITGKLNPLANPLALDIQGKVRDLELPPLSPYAIKYSGYGINRGKLSVDVNYVVQPDGQLTARNKVILNQLSFGDKVEGSTASLPVKLAVALLADRNGVIDIDLPISGSLNDPQFSLGPVIVKVILNLIVKAVTAPFSLLAGAFGGGGGDDLASVGFAPGSARLAPEATASLDKVAKALADRPALQLTVVGTASLEAEREGYRRERLNQLLRAEKRRSLAAQGSTALTGIAVSPGEYPALLKEVYKRADITKPRNMLGLARDLPVAEMEKLLLADIAVTGDAMRELALQRGVAVKDYLAGRNLAPARLFLGAAKTVSPDAKWAPRAELNLAMP